LKGTLIISPLLLNKKGQEKGKEEIITINYFS
jgi:hypothetical protein